MKAWLCKWIGCREHGAMPVCVRCDAHIYDEGFYHDGILTPLFERFVRARRRIGSLVLGKKCQNCGKRYRRGFNEYTCSAKCEYEWLPF